MAQVQIQQPPARKVEKRAHASAALEATRALPRDPYLPVAAAQSAYYLVTGLWPLLHLRSFALVTGPKPEGYLAKAVGACLANVGLTLGLSLLPDQRNRRAAVPREVRSLGLRMAITFAAFDFYYAGVRRRISPVYLVNGVVQLGFIGAWFAARGLRNRDRKTPPMPAFA